MDVQNEYEPSEGDCVEVASEAPGLARLAERLEALEGRVGALLDRWDGDDARPIFVRRPLSERVAAAIASERERLAGTGIGGREGLDAFLGDDEELDALEECGRPSGSLLEALDKAKASFEAKELDEPARAFLVGMGVRLLREVREPKVRAAWCEDLDARFPGLSDLVPESLRGGWERRA